MVAYLKKNKRKREEKEQIKSEIDPQKLKDEPDVGKRKNLYSILAV